VWSDIKELRLRLNEGAGAKDSPRREPTTLDLKPVAQTLPPSAANQLRNGDMSHSVRTWNNAAAGNQDYELAHFFTHDAPSAGQQLDESTSINDLNIDGDANTATNKTVKSSAHPQYSAAYADWLRSSGYSRMQGTKTLDAPLPGNTATPNAGLLAVAFRAALRDATIRVPDGFRVFCGVWDNTAGQRDFLKASTAFAVSAQVRGTPTGTTERRYKVLLLTDRGYEFLSSEVVVLSAPDDASFNSSCDVYLSWALLPGVIEARVYRHDIASGNYYLLEVAGSNTYADNNTKVKTESGYPAASDDRAKAYVATLTDALKGLAVDGVAAAWDTIYLNVPVPPGYNMGATTDKQWLRIGMSAALDRAVSDAVLANGSTTVQSPTAAFTSQDTGRTATVSDGTNSQTVTLTYVDATHATMSAAWGYASATGTLYVVGGGDHGLLVDLVHVSYTPGSVFAPNPEDLTRTMSPASAPAGSTQGGVGAAGGGDYGGGGIACVAVSEPVLAFEGREVRAVPFDEVREGARLFDGSLACTRVVKKTRASQPLVRLVTDANVTLDCSPSHKVITTRDDEAGRAVERLRAGDPVMVTIGGRVFQARVRAVEDLGRSGEVGTFTLAPGHVYAAGRYAPRSRLARAVGRLWGRRESACGVMSHNLKSEGLLREA
ncbi:MAG: hypothetical protein M3348_17570, partial [Acidobacteriota bacterium]|nr:hypothetical protein [Acidobacteriota bacterium]